MATTFDQTAKNKKARNLPRFLIRERRKSYIFYSWESTRQAGWRPG
jgi:hypothetical protein